MQKGDATHATHSTRPTPLWRNRDYMLLWSGQTVSIIGTQVSQIAFPLLVLALTHSPARAGFVAAARTLPYLLFALPAGALVDRWNRKRVMILCNAGSAIALASIAPAYALGVLTIPQIAVVSFVEGTFAVFYGLAEASTLAQVVPRDQLSTAVAQQDMQYAVGGIIGPSLGGALYSTSSLLPFITDATSYAISGLSLVGIRAQFQGARNAVRQPLRAEIGEGLVWFWRQPLIRTMALLMGGINFADAGGVLFIIVLLQQQGAPSPVIGAVFAAGGTGSILGAFLAPRFQQRLTFGQAIIGISWLWVVEYVAISAAGSPIIIALAFGIFAVIVPTYNTVQMSYRLTLIPEILQGRVNSVYRLVVQGVRPLGLALTGVLLERIGPVATILVFASVLAMTAMATTLNRHVRDAVPLTDRPAT